MRESNRVAEKKEILEFLGDFKMEESRAYKYITDRYSTGIVANTLFSIAKIVGAKTGVKVPRLVQRFTKCMYKWFDMHFEEFVPVLERITVYDRNGVEINHRRELFETKGLI